MSDAIDTVVLFRPVGEKELALIRESSYRFRVRAAFLQRYARRTVGASIHEEYWIPAEDLPDFNAALVGPIEVIAEFHG